MRSETPLAVIASKRAVIADLIRNPCLRRPLPLRGGCRIKSGMTARGKAGRDGFIGEAFNAGDEALNASDEALGASDEAFSASDAAVFANMKAVFDNMKTVSGGERAVIASKRAVIADLIRNPCLRRPLPLRGGCRIKSGMTARGGGSR